MTESQPTLDDAGPGGTTAEAVTRSRWSAAVLRQTGGLPTPFWWLWLGTLINRAGTFIEPFFVLYLTGPRHVSVGTTGAVLTVWGVGSLLAHPVGDVLTDRFGRRATLAASLTGTAAVLMALSFARPLLLITVLVLVLGTVADMYRPASTAAVADLVAEPDRARAYALQFWAINLGFSVASASAGVLLHFGYGVLFALDAATTLAFGLLALRFVPETRPQSDERPARLLDPVRLFRQDRLLLAGTLLLLLYGVVYTQVNVTLPLAITHSGQRAAVYGFVIALNGVLIVVLQPLTMALLDRMPRWWSLPLGMAVVGLGVGATGLCHRPWQFALTVVIWTVGEVATAGAFQALVASLAPPEQRGRYAGALGLAWGASGLVGPLLGAGAFALSPPLLWTGCAVAGAVAAFGQHRVLRAIEHRSAPAAT